MTDRKTLNQAREWTKLAVAHETSEVARAAAEVIQSLPDEWADADKVKELIKALQDESDRRNRLTPATPSDVDHNIGFVDALHWVAARLDPLLPAPPAPRTLAEMTPEERKACQWMQATYLGALHDQPGDHAITNTDGAYVRLIRRCDGFSFEIKCLSKIVPHPDLPKLEWPGNEPEEEEDTAAEPSYPRPDGCCGACPETVGGGVDCTCADNPRCPNHRPRPEGVPVGEPWQVEIDGETAIGFRNDPEDRWPWCVTYEVNSRSDWLGDSDVTLIARLVPETTEQDDEWESDEPDPAYVYRDREGDEWECILGRWIHGDTHAKRVAERESRPGRASLPEWFGPYTRVGEHEDTPVSRPASEQG